MKAARPPEPGRLSRREREIMEIVYRTPGASVEEIRAGMPQPASYSAVRVIVNVLERKGHLRHVRRGRKYLYSPTTPRSKAVKGALTSLLRTYFDDSVHLAVSAMVRLRAKDMSEEDWRELADAIERSRKGEPV
jgi:BlaI family transcriptional regulator, penicillinase repressor